MKELRSRFERFCFRNRDKGIPNLMLYISIGSAVVYLMSIIGRSNLLYAVLCFDRTLILRGQIWRLFTYVLTYAAEMGNILFVVIGLLCYYTLGRAMERSWGTLRFNLFYLSGVVLMDAFCMLLGGRAYAYYLNMSLFLGYATMYPSAQFLFLFIIPVRAWIFALIDIGLTLFDVVTMALSGAGILSLFPLVAIANYFLFFGKDVLNILPVSWRTRLRRPKSKVAQKPISFRPADFSSEANAKAPYLHRCTVCGKTDLTDPDMEFRYCSRCNGYYCYCSDHIGNHEHIQ